MIRYLFLTAWVENSDSASGDPTSVHDSMDLWPQYQKGNPYVFAVEIQGAMSEQQAIVYGRAEAWHDNYTAHDAVSDVVTLTHDYQHPNPVKVITVR